jgi:hypothetical protein
MRKDTTIKAKKDISQMDLLVYDDSASIALVQWDIHRQAVKITSP